MILKQPIEMLWPHITIHHFTKKYDYSANRFPRTIPSWVMISPRKGGPYVYVQYIFPSPPGLEPINNENHWMMVMRPRTT